MKLLSSKDFRRGGQKEKYGIRKYGTKGDVRNFVNGTDYKPRSKEYE